MGPKDLREALEQVRTGQLSVDAALEQLNGAAMADLGYANVDLHRRERCGFPEVIFCGRNGTVSGRGCIAGSYA